MVLIALVNCSRTTGDGEETSSDQAEMSGLVESPAITGLEAEEGMRQAALNGDAKRVIELLDTGTNVNAPDQEGHTALMFAAFNGHTEIVLALIDSNAVVDRRDLQGRTALLYASTGPFPETVKVRLEKGAEPNIVDSDEHFSPLMHAAAEGNLDVVKLLVANGADLSLTDVDHDNAESFARQAGHLEVADFLQSLQ